MTEGNLGYVDGMVRSSERANSDKRTMPSHAMHGFAPFGDGASGIVLPGFPSVTRGYSGYAPFGDILAAVSWRHTR